MASWGDGNVFSVIRSDFNCFYTCALKSNPHFIIITKPLPSYKKCAFKKNKKTTLRAVSFLNKTHYYFFRQAVNGVFPYFHKKLNMTFAGGLEGAVQTWLRLLPFHWLIPIRPYSLSLIHQPSLLAVNVQSLSQWKSHVRFQKVARLYGPRVNFPLCLSVATSSWHRLTQDTHYVP